MFKFPKTPRVVEVLQEDCYREWKRHTAVVEEKIDGANVGIWFDGAELQLQSRGHVLRGGAGERQFSRLHGWAAERHIELFQSLGTQYVLFGEWCFAQHKAFYDVLPDLLVGYDVFDRATGLFLPTQARDAILAACKAKVVPRLWKGAFGKAPAFGSFLGPSRFKTAHWREALAEEAQKAGAKDPMRVTDDSNDMEGVYVRIESEASVVGRMKLHRTGFEKIRNDDWRIRPLIRNRVRS
jgi:hypothetical protein